MRPVTARAPALPLAIAAIALILPLAACKQQPSVSATNATASEVQQKVAAATGGEGVSVEPGRWEVALTIHDMDIPGMPPQVKEQMKKQMGGTQHHVNCITEEDVKAQKAFFTGKDNDKTCKYDHFALSGGHIDATMSCAQERGGKMTTTISGTYAAESYHMDMAGKGEGQGPMGAMSMKMTVDGKRVGACKGTKDEL